MQLKFDLHIHSGYSFDSNLKINQIIKEAKKKKLDGLAITDHEEFIGTEVAEKNAKGLVIIKGQEINTEYGDIIGLFLEKKINSKKFLKVIEEIKKQNGIVILPHPAIYHILSKEVLDKVDFIETFNSRVGKEANKMADLLAFIYKKNKIAGSDAHLFFEIGNGITIVNSKSKQLEDIKKAMLSGKTKIIKKYPSKSQKLIINWRKLWKKK